MYGHFLIVTPEERIRELEQSHDHLRGMLIAAGRQIRKFRHNPENAKMLHLLRRTLREAREVRRNSVQSSACSLDVLAATLKT